MSDSYLGLLAGYPGFFVACLMSGWLLPVPEDIVLVYGGIRIANQEATWLGTLVVGFLGVGTRDSVMWSIGHFVGEPLLAHPWTVRLLGQSSIHRAKQVIIDKGPVAILGGRFLAGFRTPLFLVAGATGIPYRRFAAWDFLGLCVVLPMSTTIGYYFGPTIVNTVLGIMSQMRVATGLIFLGFVGWRIYRFFQHTPDEPPESRAL